MTNMSEELARQAADAARRCQASYEAWLARTRPDQAVSRVALMIGQDGSIIGWCSNDASPADIQDKITQLSCVRSNIDCEIERLKTLVSSKE